MANINKLNDTDQKVYDSYMHDLSTSDPESYKTLAGVDPIHAYGILKNEPDFNDVSKLVLGQKFGTNADQPGSYVSKVLDNTNKMLGTGGPSLNPIPAVANIWNDVVGPVGDSINFLGDKLLEYGNNNDDTILGSAAKTIGQMSYDAGISTRTDNLGAISMMVAPVAGAISEAAGARPPIDVPSSVSDADVLGPEIGPARTINIGPQGVASQIKPDIAEVPALTARELATVNGIRTPAVHNLAAKNIVESNLKSVHDFASGFYNQLSDPAGPYFNSGLKEVPEAFDQHVEDMRPFTEQINSIPKQFRNGATNRLSKALTSDLTPEEKQANYDNLLQSGDYSKEELDAIRATAEGEKQPFTINSLASMRKMYGSIYAKNIGNPLGAMAKAGADSTGELMSEHADQSWKGQLDQANSAWGMYKKTFDNPYVQDFLSKDSADLHDTIMGSKRGSAEAVNAIQAAGGDDAITNLKKAHTYDLLGKVATAGDSEKTFLQYQYDHQDSMNALYPNEEQDEFFKLAKGLDKAKDSYARSVKQNQTSSAKASELADAQTIDPNAQKPVPVEIKSKQSSAIYDAAKSLVGVVNPAANRALTIGEKLLKAKEVLGGK